MYCEQCGTRSLPGQTYCTVCGNRIIDMVVDENFSCNEERVQYCKSCGTPAEANYCTACGKPVVERSNWSPNSAPFSLGDFKAPFSMNEAMKKATELGGNFRSKVERPLSKQKKSLDREVEKAGVYHQIMTGLKDEIIGAQVVAFTYCMFVSTFLYTLIAMMSEGGTEYLFSASSVASLLDRTWIVAAAALIRMKITAGDGAYIVISSTASSFLITGIMARLCHYRSLKSPKSTLHYIITFLISSIATTSSFFIVFQILADKGLVLSGFFGAVGFLTFVQILVSFLYKKEYKLLPQFFEGGEFLPLGVSFLKEFGVFTGALALTECVVYMIEILLHAQPSLEGIIGKIFYAVPIAWVWRSLSSFGVPLQFRAYDEGYSIFTHRGNQFFEWLLIIALLIVLVCHLMEVARKMKKQQFIKQWAFFAGFVALSMGTLAYLTSPRATLEGERFLYVLFGASFWVTAIIVFVVLSLLGGGLYIVQGYAPYESLFYLYFQHKRNFKISLGLVVLLLIWLSNFNLYEMPMSLNRF